MSPQTDPIISLPYFRVLKQEAYSGVVEIHADYEGISQCPRCQHQVHWIKDSFQRRVRHESIGSRVCYLVIHTHKFKCQRCRKYFRECFDGIGKYQRATDPFKKEVVKKHDAGICQSRLGSMLRMGHATIERWYSRAQETKIKELSSRVCPRVIGIDEHFFSRKDGFATTIADLQKRRIHDLGLGHSVKGLKSFMASLKERERVKVAVMDLSTTYRAVVSHYMPQAMIVADRFHVIRLINQSFMKTWNVFDQGPNKWSRGLKKLLQKHAWKLNEEQKKKMELFFQEHPGFRAFYDFKQELCTVMKAHCSCKRQARALATTFLSMIESLKSAPMVELQKLGHTLDDWKEEIARMWRFKRTNSTLEGLHNAMEVISRMAYGFKNFKHYRTRVLVKCGY